MVPHVRKNVDGAMDGVHMGVRDGSRIQFPNVLMVSISCCIHISQNGFTSIKYVGERDR